MAYWDGDLNGSNNNYKIRLEMWQSSQNWGGNYSVVEWRVYLVSYNNAYPSWYLDGTNNWSANIGGAGYGGNFSFDFRPASANRVILIGAGNTTIGHDANGYASVGGSAAVNTHHSSVGDGSVGGAIGLDRIPKPPAAPTSLGFDQIGADTMRYRFSGNSDNGSAVVEWQMQLATNSAFTTGVQNISSNGTTVLNGLSNHTQYWARARGRNAMGWGPYSSASTASTLGHPTAPLSLNATPSTTVTGRISLSWSPPTTTGAGGIKGYTIFRDGVQIGTTTGTGTTYTDNNRTPYTSYSYRVAARNDYSNSVSGTGPQSTADSAVAPGPPGAPTNLTAVADGGVAGKVNLSWTAPTNTGAGGITGYKVYFAGGSLIVNQNGTGTTYAVTGLTPGSTYSFQVFARNALSDAEGTMSAGSNTPTVTPIGEPAAPTGLTATTTDWVSNRIQLSWTAPAGVLSGYSIFMRDGSGNDTLLQKIGVNHTSYSVDNLSNGVNYSFVVRARTVYTDTLADGYPGNWGGPPSNVASATASNNSDQFVIPSLNAVTSGTNAVFNGTYVISGVTSNTISYAKSNPDIPSVSSGGTIANSTNTIFNGSYTISSTPTPNTITYAKTNSNIGLLSVFSGTVTNTTNSSLNATNVQVTAVNTGAQTVTYTKNGVDVAPAVVPINTPPGGRGLVTNLTNALFNVTGKVITAATSDTFSYSQTGSDVVENNAAGLATNITNRDLYNGEKVVLSTPTFKRITYTVPANSETTETRTWEDPSGTVERSLSLSKLEVRYRSGWIG